MKRRYFTIPLLFLLLAFIIFIQSASHHIVSPKRARLRDQSHAIMAEPTQHGMTISSHINPDGTPYLLCKGLPLTGEKGRLLRSQLSARNFKPSPQPSTLLLLHGHASRKENQLAIAERFCAVGFTCIIPDLPAHGEHPQQIGTFGKKEVPLLLDLLRTVQSQHSLPTKFHLFGLSQGGAIALQLAAADQNRFHSVVTISTFANLSETLSHTASNQSPLLATLFPAVAWNLQWQHHLNLKKISPSHAAENLTLPVFVAHGLADRFIPSSNAESIYQRLSHPQKRLRLIPEANHGNVLARGELIYADLCEFLLTNQ